MKVLIVDDEAPARDRLRQLIEDSGQHDIVGEAGHGQEALDVAAKVSPDVVLLDIRMPGVDGIETAHHLNTFPEPPAIVFTTAYDEYAIDAFEANAIGYVLKPVRRERLEQALSQAARLTSAALFGAGQQSGISEQRRHVCARIQGELKLIPVADVLCFVADQKYVSVIHSAGRDLIDDPLKSLEEEFADQFVRIHRGALVAVEAVDALKKDEEGRTQVILRNCESEALYVSRRHVADVKRRLKKG
jgi:two-component system response regulator AlgR